MHKNKKILVTGGHGFLGSSLCRKLKERGYENIITFRSKEYDLTREREVSRLFEEKGPFDVVIHLAGSIGGISFFKENPGRAYYENLMMNTLVQEYSRKNNVSKFIGVGSVLSYPHDTPIPFREENLWQGALDKDTSSYGMAKLSMLLQSQAYNKQYGFNAISLIMTNLYGYGYDFNQKDLHVIPSLIKKFDNARKSGEKIVSLWGSGKATREFLYVDDAAEAIIEAMEKYDKPEPINIGSGRETSIKELAEKISELVGFKGELVWDITKPEGKLRSVSDVLKAKAEFGFKARTTLEEGLKNTINWYRSFYT